MQRRSRYQLAINISPTDTSEDYLPSGRSYSVMEAGGMCEDRVTNSTIATVLKYICSILCFGMRDIQIDLDEEEIIITDFVVNCGRQDGEPRNQAGYNSIFH